MSAVDDLARRLRGLRESTTIRQSVTVGGGGGGTTPPPGMRNPMRRFGSMIRGGQDGAPVELLPGLEGQVLTMVDGRPQWRYPTLAGVEIVTYAGDFVVTAAGEQVVTA